MDAGGTLWRGKLSGSTKEKKEAKAFYGKAATFSLKGNHVWYLGRNEQSGPVTLANEISERNFSFKAADEWYRRRYGSASKTKMHSWASKVLGLDGKTEIVKPENVEDVGKAAEETVIKDNPYGMVKPKSPKGVAQARDIEYKHGFIESTENPNLGHGLVPGKPSSKATEEEWETYMKDKVIVAWNNYTAKVLEKAGESIKEAEKYIKTTSSKKANRNLKVDGINIAASQKMRHEVSLSLVRNQALNNMMRWREGIPIGKTRDKKTGLRTYASTTVDYNKNKMNFIHNKTVFVTGVNHMAGIADSNKDLTRKEQSAFYLEQQRHYMQMRANNTGSVRTVNSKTFQSISKASTGVNHVTQVSFSPKACKQWLYEVGDAIDKEMKKELLEKTNNVKKAVDKKKKQMKDNGGMFWALPYIGVQEGVHIAK